jgi:hypothetical protein
MEIKLPLYWNTSTRHMMWCRVFKQLSIHGRFWAHNLLIFERMHVFLKSCCRSSKVLLRSVMNSYDVHSALQTWLFENEWVTTSRRSSLAHRLSDENSLQLTSGFVEILHAKKWRPENDILSNDQFSQVQDIWAIYNPAYDKLKDRYHRAMAKAKVKVPIAEWKVNSGRFLTSEERKMKSMTADVKVCLCVYNYIYLLCL